MDFQVADVPLPEHLQTSPALQELESVRGSDKDEIKGEGAGGIRFRALRQEGLRLGAQTGLAWRYNMIMQYLDKTESKLNVIYSFARFVRDGRVLIPAVVEVKNKFQLDEQTGQATIVRSQITVEEEAKIISVVPTWRDYLWQQYTYPEKPHPSLRPRSDDEAAAWKQAVNEGWRAGISQADDIYSDRLASLTKATEGRSLYNTLESNKVFTPAALKVVANKVTFNGRTMNVGEVIYSINKKADYTTATDWKPVWTRQ
jgi:defect-in-organelle-trafficking protein DotC